MIINTHNEELILDLREASSEQVEAAVAGAREAFGQWSQTTPGDRSAALLEIASRIESEEEAFGNWRRSIVASRSMLQLEMKFQQL